MARAIEQIEVRKKLRAIDWHYIAPEFPIIHEGNDFIFINRDGEAVKFGFDEIWHWLYDEDYVGCWIDCSRCLTPIC